MRAACTDGVSPCSASATRLRSRKKRCSSVGARPVASRKTNSVNVARPMRSPARSRPRTVTRSLAARRNRGRCGAALADQHGRLLLKRPSLPPSHGARFIVGQSRDCRTIAERPCVSNAAPAPAMREPGMDRPTDDTREDAQTARTRRPMGRLSRSLSRGCATTFWRAGSRPAPDWSRASSRRAFPSAAGRCARR